MACGLMATLIPDTLKCDMFKFHSLDQYVFWQDQDEYSDLDMHRRIPKLYHQDSCKSHFYTTNTLSCVIEEVGSIEDSAVSCVKC